MHGEPRQVGVLPDQHDLLTRRLGARHFDDLGSVLQSSLNFGKEAARLDPEGRSEPVAAAHHATDQFRPLGTCGTKQHRLGVALQNLGDAGEIDRLVADFELA